MPSTPVYIDKLSTGDLSVFNFLTTLVTLPFSKTVPGPSEVVGVANFFVLHILSVGRARSYCTGGGVRGPVASFYTIPGEAQRYI